MKYPYTVKMNGVYFAAGEEVPDAVEEEEPLPFSDVVLPYTKTEISRMTKAELYDLAVSIGTENADKMNRSELISLLISAFGL